MEKPAKAEKLQRHFHVFLGEVLDHLKASNVFELESHGIAFEFKDMYMVQFFYSCSDPKFLAQTDKTQSNDEVRAALNAAAAAATDRVVRSDDETEDEEPCKIEAVVETTDPKKTEAVVKTTDPYETESDEEAPVETSDPYKTESDDEAPVKAADPVAWQSVQVEVKIAAQEEEEDFEESWNRNMAEEEAKFLKDFEEKEFKK